MGKPEIKILTDEERKAIEKSITDGNTIILKSLDNEIPKETEAENDDYDEFELDE